MASTRDPSELHSILKLELHGRFPGAPDHDYARLTDVQDSEVRRLLRSWGVPLRDTYEEVI